MATQLESVILNGKFKGEEVTARFDRLKRRDVPRKLGWVLSISIGGKCHRYEIRNNTDKPCWSVAVAHMENPSAKPKPWQERLRDSMKRQRRRASDLKLATP